MEDRDTTNEPGNSSLLPKAKLWKRLPRGDSYNLGEGLRAKDKSKLDLICVLNKSGPAGSYLPLTLPVLTTALLSYYSLNRGILFKKTMTNLKGDDASCNDL